MQILSLNYETALGSAIHATPVFAALRELRPEWRIHVAAMGISKSILEKNPSVHKMHSTVSPVQNTFQAALQFMKLGYRENFDVVLINANNSRPRIAWNSRFINARKSIGISTDKRYVSTSIPISEGNSVAMNNLLMLKPLIPELNINEYAEAFEFYINKESADRAKALRENLLKKNELLIGYVTQTSGGQPSEWWNERFIQVVNNLYEKTGCKSVFFGTSDQSEKINKICEKLGNRALSLAGKTQIEDLAGLCSICDLIISLDTGVMHLGRVVDVPMVVIAPAWQPAYEWLPINNSKIKVLRKWDIGCRHCRKFVCSTRECMDEITVQDVVNEALSHLEKFPANENARSTRLNKWILN